MGIQKICTIIVNIDPLTCANPGVRGLSEAEGAKDDIVET